MPSTQPFIVRKAAVLGAGVMGAQIAAHLVNANVETLLFELPAKDGDPNGNALKAIDNLRKQGVLRAASKAGREARQGLVTSYIHPGDQLGVLIEVSCETDFVART
ncbi:MAG: 3-hydroxyacyl-CoA dehydrogenase NAD-binding domain-containing protein, partial [Pseudomonadota bacterium]